MTILKSKNDSANNDTSILSQFFKASALTFIFLLSFVIITIVAGGLFAYSKVITFTNSAQITINELKQTIFQGLNQPVVSSENKINFLILGVDSLKTRGDIPPLTDTMMLVSLDLSTGKITTLPFPRDLWSDEYKTKINALYAYGQDKYPDHPERFPTEVVSDWTGLTIHYPIVLSMEQVSDVIDLLGGIEVNVQQGFIDTQFPRPDVDVTIERDPEKLYMTVEFEQGKQIMSGQKALQYIRSRHSENLDTGTDNARAQRQQQVIQSVIDRVKQQEVLFNPTLLGSLYRYYLDNFENVLPTTQLIAIAKQIYPVRNQISFISKQLSVYPDDENGQIYHPPTWQTQNQWVYTIRDVDKFPEQVKKLIE